MGGEFTCWQTEEEHTPAGPPTHTDAHTPVCICTDSHLLKTIQNPGPPFAQKSHVCARFPLFSLLGDSERKGRADHTDNNNTPAVQGGKPYGFVQYTLWRIISKRKREHDWGHCFSMWRRLLSKDGFLHMSQISHANQNSMDNVIWSFDYSSLWIVTHQTTMTAFVNYSCRLALAGFLFSRKRAAFYFVVLTALIWSSDGCTPHYLEDSEQQNM